MVRPGLGLFGPAGFGAPLDGGEDDAMQRPAALVEQGRVRHVVGEGMLEGVLEVGEESFVSYRNSAVWR